MKIIVSILVLVINTVSGVVTERSKLYLYEVGTLPTFGYSVLWEENTLFMGSIRSNTDSSINTGAVYVFNKLNEQWVQTDHFWPSDVQRGDFFGYSISKISDLMIVGAPQESNVEVFSGAAYVFQHNGNEWIQISKLKSELPIRYEFFGHTVHENNDRIMVGSTKGIYEFRVNDGVWTMSDFLSSSNPSDSYFFSFDAKDNVMVTADMSDSTLGYRNGSVYLFELKNDSWVNTEQLFPSVMQEDISFGYSVAFDGDRIAVGAIRSYINGPESGSVYIFEKVNGNWVETNIIHPAVPEEHMFFGFSLFLDENKLLVGAPGNAIEDANSYVFEFHLVDSTWIQTAVYQSSNVDPQDRFGTKVTQRGSEVLVTATGAFDEDEQAFAAYFFDNDFIFASGFNQLNEP
ncbi:hypothetical protein ACFODZ_16455 [Marinicella sediminis]|uniref:Uncharacterized protein n=1 Tax=Marinicella sediminis TaxID=1792834 RepID=A0ABV7JHX9_9GAMM|nr:FG-GAP repeat protein [Marinicella sediminis]